MVLKHKNCIFAIALFSPLEKRHDPAHLNKLETHSSKGMFEIVVVLYKKHFFFIFFSIFLLFRYHLRLKTRHDPSLKKKIPFTQECFVLSLAEIGLVVLEKEICK